MNIQEIVNKGKAAAQSGYEKGNGLMDKVPVLKSKRNKLIVWGSVGTLFIVLVFGMLGGGAGDPFDVVKNTTVALASGDLETFFDNIYLDDDSKEKLSNLSDSEAELLERQIVQGFAGAFADMSEDEQKLMIEVFSSMKCEKVTKKGDDAEVVVKVRKIGGEEVLATYFLKKDDGMWKMDMSKWPSDI